MKTIFHPADKRGHANHGWLNAYHSFSFGGFYDPSKVQFGALRVLNDDTVSPAMGFSKHPHHNMEIITIPTQGALAHRDSTGRSETIKTGEVQIMSAGSGIEHSESNGSKTDAVKLFQIWILPEKQNIAPRYDQRVFDWKAIKNEWKEVVSPENPEALWINQQAWLSLSVLETGKRIDYFNHKSNHGMYLLVIEGSAKIGEQILNKRDAIGVWESDKIEIEALENSELLLIEVPM